MARQGRSGKEIGENEDRSRSRSPSGHVCDACVVERGRSLGPPCHVARYAAPFDFRGRSCQTACPLHRELLEMPPPDDWRPPGRPARPSDFMMDLENGVLEHAWDWRKGIPRGPRRHEHPEWAAVMRRKVDPYHSDVTWAEYVDWVVNGGGDDWFEEGSTCIPGFMALSAQGDITDDLGDGEG